MSMVGGPQAERLAQHAAARSGQTSPTAALPQRPDPIPAASFSFGSRSSDVEMRETIKRLNTMLRRYQLQHLEQPLTESDISFAADYAQVLPPWTIYSPLNHPLLSAYESYIRELESSNQNFQNDCQRLVRETHDLIRENEQLRNELSSALESLAQSSATASGAESLQMDADMRERAVLLAEENDLLLQQIRKMEEDRLRRDEIESARARERASARDREIDDLKRLVASYEEAERATQKQLTSLTLALEQAQRQRESAERELVRIERAAEHDAFPAAKMVATLTDELRLVMRERDELHAQVDRSQNEVRRLSAAMQAEHGARGIRTSDAEQLRTRVLELENEVKRLRDANRDTLQRCKVDMEQERTRLEGRLKSTQAEVARLELTLAECQSLLGGLSKERTAYKTQYEETKGELDLTLESLNRAEEEAREAKNELALFLRRELDSMQTRREMQMAAERAALDKVRLERQRDLAIARANDATARLETCRLSMRRGDARVMALAADDEESMEPPLSQDEARKLRKLVQRLRRRKEEEAAKTLQ
jgi:chromosome segregation ATPase